MPKPRLFVEVGQRIGVGVVTDPEVRIPRPGNPRRKERGARLLCDCGGEYAVAMHYLVGSRADVMSCGCMRGRRLGWIIDRTGQRFGRLTVVELAEVKREARWLCRCDCGGEIVTRGSCLANGDTKSCGCLAKDRLGPRAVARRTVLNSYKGGARARGLPWDLSDDDFDRLTALPCSYCGTPPSRTHAVRRSSFTYNGIDRVDSSLGYTPENAVPCCTICNRAKSDLPYDAWMAWIGRVATHAWFSPSLVPSRLLKGTA